MGVDRKYSQSVSARVLKALGMFGSVQVVNIICSVIRVKLLSVWVGPAGVGLNALFNNTRDLVSSSTQLNMRQSSVRDIAAADNDGERRLIAAAVGRWGLWLGLAGLLVMMALSPVFSYVSFGNFDYTLQFCVLAAVMVMLGVSNADMAVMQGFGRLKMLARVNLVSGVVSTAAAIPAYWLWGLDAIVPVIAVFAFVTMVVCRYEIACVTRGFPVPSAREVFARGKGFLKLGAYITVANLFMVVIQYVFAVYLNRVVSTEQLGVYQAGNTLVTSYIGFVFTAVTLEFYPRLAARVKSRRRMSVTVNHEVVMLLWIVLPLLVMFECFSDLVIELLYSSRFVDVVPYVAVAVVGVVFRGAAVCFSYTMLARGDGKAYLVVEGVSCAFGLVANLIGYEYFGFVGLGASYLLWYCIYAVMTALVCRRRYRLDVSATTVALVVGSAVTVGAAAVMKAYAGAWLPAVAILPWLIPLSIRRIRHISGK